VDEERQVEYMPAFNAEVQTPLAVPDPGTDHKLPPSGSLSYGVITSTSAVACTNGAHATLIHGNDDCQTNGNESTRITQNRSHTIGGNQDKKITGNKTENVIQNFIQTTLGNLHRTVIGATNDIYAAAHSIEHKANQLLKEPVAYFHDVAEHFVKNTEHHDEYQMYQLYALWATNMIGVNVDLKGSQTALIGFVGEAHGYCHKERVADADIKGIHNDISALKDQVGAIQPSVYIAMFHEVSITQKIIIIGGNQVI
jgi:hypothetical protein